MGKVIMSGVAPCVNKATASVPPGFVQLKDVAEGGVVNINENGAPAAFYVAKHDYEPALNGAGRTLLVRVDGIVTRAWSKIDNSFGGSDIDAYMSETYPEHLSASVRSLIGKTRIYATLAKGSTSAPVLVAERAAFALSARELGGTSVNFNDEGAELPTAAMLRASVSSPSTWTTGFTLNDQWTRSPGNMTGFTSGNDFAAGYCGTDEKMYIVSVAGGTKKAYRPCFTLPATALFDEETALLKEVP